jgi:hypothetical protein
VAAIVGYNSHQVNSLSRNGGFVQDRATVGRATLSAGLRYDRPRTVDDNTGKTLLSFNQFSPRLGVAYDLAGNGRSIARLGAGRYYDKVPTYGVGTYAGTGFDPITYYGVITMNPPDPTNIEALRAIIKPGNITRVFNSQQLPVQSGIRGPHSDVLNLGFDQEIGRKWTGSLNYIYRHTKDFVSLTQVGKNVTYAPVTITSPFTGRTFTIWKVTGGGPREFGLGNLDFFFQRSQMAIAELRGRPTERLYVDGSIALERSRGTRQNNECGVLSLCTNGVDTDPNYEQNAFYTAGSLAEERPWQIKLRGDWNAPLGLDFGWDLRYFSGRHYGATNYCFQTMGCNDPFYGSVLLEPRDARKEKNSKLINLRVAKNFDIAHTKATISLDALNVTNEAIDFNTNIQNNINATYGKESTRSGKSVSAFGKPYSLAPPRQYRVGLRVAF